VVERRAVALNGQHLPNAIMSKDLGPGLCHAA
jgi:hypothetical protein